MKGIWVEIGVRTFTYPIGETKEGKDRMLPLPEETDLERDWLG